MNHKWLCGCLALLLALIVPFCALAEEANVEETFAEPAEAAVAEAGDLPLAEAEDLPEDEALSLPEDMPLLAADDWDNWEDDEWFDSETFFGGSAKRTYNLFDRVPFMDEYPYTKCTSSDKKVIAVTNYGDYAILHMKKKGTAKITAVRTDGKKRTLTITVKDMEPATGIVLKDTNGEEVLSKKTITICLGEEIWLLGVAHRYGETCLDERQNNKWKISDKSIARLDPDNIECCVYGKKPGKAKITVTSYNGKKDTLTVKVVRNKVDKLNPKPSTKTIKANYKGTACAILKSVEMRWDKEKIVCEYYIVNGSSRTRNIWVDEITLIDAAQDLELCYKGRFTVKSVPAYGCKILKVTFTPSEEIWLPDYELHRRSYAFDWYDECEW